MPKYPHLFKPNYGTPATHVVCPQPKLVPNGHLNMATVNIFRGTALEGKVKSVHPYSDHAILNVDEPKLAGWLLATGWLDGWLAGWLAGYWLLAGWLANKIRATEYQQKESCHRIPTLRCGTANQH